MEILCFRKICGLRIYLMFYLKQVSKRYKCRCHPDGLKHNSPGVSGNFLLQLSIILLFETHENKFSYFHLLNPDDAAFCFRTDIMYYVMCVTQELACHHTVIRKNASSSSPYHMFRFIILIKMSSKL